MAKPKLTIITKKIPPKSTIHWLTESPGGKSEFMVKLIADWLFHIFMDGVVREVRVMFVGEWVTNGQE